MYIRSRNITELFYIGNQQANLLNQWFNANKLTLNVDKTKIMIYPYKKIRIPNDQQLNIDNKVSFKDHIYYIRKRISQKLPILNKVKTN